MITQKQRLMMIGLTVALLLLIPFLAMQFTEEVHWTAFDFIVAAVLLLGTGFLGELIVRKVSKPRHRIVMCAALLIAFLLVWAELAVGIFNSPLAGS